MKLELKHLAPYLPYGLNYDISHTEYGKIEKDRLTECRLKGIHKSLLTVIILLVTNIKQHNDGRLYFNISLGKPILRPLSDLTKEIEHNGEKFVPLEWFLKKYRPLKSPERILDLPIVISGCSSKDYVARYKDWLCPIFIFQAKIDQNEYRVIQKLYEWHFDVDNLIGNNLAIDINTLNK